VVWIGLGDHRTPVYAAVVALVVNLAVVAAAGPVLARGGPRRLRTGSGVGPS
jgi:hypothetical protein